MVVIAISEWKILFFVKLFAMISKVRQAKLESSSASSVALSISRLAFSSLSNAIIAIDIVVFSC